MDLIQEAYRSSSTSRPSSSHHHHPPPNTYPVLIYLALDFPPVIQLAIDSNLKALEHHTPPLHPISSSRLPGTPYHVSLSRNFNIRHRTIEDLIHNLRQELALHEPIQMALSGAMQCFPNDDETRTFVSLLFEKQSSNALHALIRCVDAALAPLLLPPYYHDPIPHVSVAYMDGKMQPFDSCCWQPIAWSTRIRAVTLLIGDRLHSIPLGKL